MVMNIELSKESHKLLCILYKEYLTRRKSNTPKVDAKFFTSAHEIHEKFLQDILFEDVNGACAELSRKELIHCSWYDNTAYSITITDDGIIYMENRFKNGLKDVLDFLTLLKP